MLTANAPLRYIVDQSLKPQYIIVAKPEIKKVEDLRGKTLGYARVGAADYDEGATTLERFFNMKVGRDYKVIQFQGEPERIAALANGDIAAALVSVPRAYQAKQAGFNVLLRTGDYLPRAGGAFWCTEEFFQKNPETVKKFIRAIAKGVMYYRDNKEGSYASMKEHLGVQSDEEAGVLWDELHNTFAAELPPDLYREIFESRRLDLIAAEPVAEGQAAARPGAVSGAGDARRDAQGDELRSDQDRRQAEVTTFMFARLAVAAALTALALSGGPRAGDCPGLSEQGDPSHRALHARLAE